jgi:hypothetical protein
MNDSEDLERVCEHCGFIISNLWRWTKEYDCDDCGTKHQLKTDFDGMGMEIWYRPLGEDWELAYDI